MTTLNSKAATETDRPTGACTLCDVVKPDERALRDHVLNVHPDEHCGLYHQQPCQTDRRERYAVAIHDAMESDLSLGDQEPAYQALIARAAEAAMARADAEIPTVLRMAADVAESLRQFEPATGARKSAQVSENVGILRVAEALRRLADEAASA